ncbi:MAG: hypothetical protein JXQ96_18780 [Cyclobacteriaceae bacterium]
MNNFFWLWANLLLLHSTAIAQTAIIRFDQFTVQIPGLALWNQSQLHDSVHYQTAEVYMELGEALEGSNVHIVDHSIKQLQVEQKMETSITIMGEGPHCDLLNWKHFDTGWQELNQEKSNLFNTIMYSPKTANLFPEVSMNDVKEAVKKECGDGWAEKIRNLTSILEYPSTVGTSRYFLRISGINESGKIIQKLIILNYPMGC